MKSASLNGGLKLAINDRLYLNEYLDLPLLSADQELEIGKKLYFLRDDFLQKCFRSENFLKFMAEKFTNINTRRVSLEHALSKRQICSGFIGLFAGDYLHMRSQDLFDGLLAYADKFQGSAFIRIREIVSDYGVNDSGVSDYGIIARSCQKKNEGMDKSIDEMLKEKESLERMLSEYISDQGYQALIKHNQGWVIKIAKCYKYNGLSSDDLIGEGNIGLIRAIDLYDFRRGVRFSTYSKMWIERFIQFALKNNSRLNINYSVHNQLLKLGKEARERSSSGEQVTLKDCINEIEDGNERRSLWLLFKSMIRLDQSGSPEFIDEESRGIGTEDKRKLVKSCEDKEKGEIIDEAFYLLLKTGKITERDTKLYQRIYGLCGEKSCSSVELGRELGVTRQCINNIKKRVDRSMAKIIRLIAPSLAEEYR